MRGIVQRALTEIQRAWTTVAELTFKLERYEIEGDFVQIAPASEIVMVVSFEVSIGPQKYMMNLCFPTFALDDVLAKLNIQHFSGIDDPDLTQFLLREFCHAVIREIPHFIGLVAEIFEAQPDVRRVCHQGRAPVIEDLEPTE